FLKDLDSDRFAVRERALRGLRELGDAAEPALRRALADGLPAAVRDRVERLLADLGPSGERLRIGRALEVLERMPSAAAGGVVEDVSGGAGGAWLTGEAGAALVRWERIAPGR